MACSAGFCLSSTTCCDPLAKHDTSTVLEFRQTTLPHSQLLANERRGRQAPVCHASSEDSSQTCKVSSGEKQTTMSRRALMTLLGVFTQASNFSSARADGMTRTNESEQIRQDMIQSIEARLNNPSGTVTPPNPVAGFDDETKGSVSPMDSKKSSLHDFMSLSSEPVINEKDKQTSSQDGEPNDSLSGYLNGVGYVGAGALGGLYWLERQAKVSSVSALQESSTKLKAKEDAMVALKEQLEGKLSQEKDKALQQYKREQEKQVFLSNELSSATKLANNLQLELDEQRDLVKRLQQKIKESEVAMLVTEKEKESLEETLFNEKTKANNLEEEIRVLNSKVDSKELEITTLRSVVQDKERASELASSRLNERVKELSNAQRMIEDLEKERISITENLSLSETAVQDLRGNLAAAIAHGEETQKQLAMVYQELNVVKESSALELQAFEVSLTSKVAEVEELKVKLDMATKESERIKITGKDLQEEILVLRQDVIKSNGLIEQLEGELDASLQDLKSAKAQVVSLTEDLSYANESNRVLDKRILDVQQEAVANLTVLQQAVDYEHSLSIKATEELMKVRENLDFSRKEAMSLSEQLRKLEFSYEQLKKDFIISEEAVKATSFALTKEKEMVAENRKQLDSARRAISEAKESIKFLRQDVEKANIEVENMNKEISDLRRELETATAKIATLQMEKGSLSDLLQEEKMLSSSMREKLQQLDTVLEKLSREKEFTSKRTKKLEGDLASTKGEVLRMKKQVTSMDTALEEAKSRVQGFIEGVRSQEQSTSAAQISSEIHSVQAELSHMQKSLEDAGKVQAEAEAAMESLQGVISQSESAEDAVLVSSQLKHDREV